MDTPWLRATGLYKGFRTPHRHIEVLRGIDLAVPQGQVVAVTGPSGSGKSTLLNLLGSLDRPDEGSILWGGRVLHQLSDGERSRLRNLEVGFVFQFHHLLPDFTALENVMMPALVAGVGAAERRARAQELLEAVGLADRQEHRPGELSGGEQQRVAVARALVNAPKLLLADEPGGNLDRERADQLHELLLSMRTRSGLALVVVTHDEGLARRADVWLHLEQGRLGPKQPTADGGSGR
jgi:lipoprotein-releasing system ATP-binding protein